MFWVGLISWNLTKAISRIIKLTGSVITTTFRTFFEFMRIFIYAATLYTF